MYPLIRPYMALGGLRSEGWVINTLTSSIPPPAAIHSFSSWYGQKPVLAILEVPPYKGALLTDTDGRGDTHTSRHVDRGIHPILIHKSVLDTTGILIRSHDLPCIVNIIDNRIVG